MSTVRERAAQLMEHLCAHSAHGYSQPNRAGIGTGGGEGETVTLTDGTVVKISSGDRDCSSAVIECYAALGVNCGGASYTGNMRSLMTRTGNFKWHAMGSGYTAKRGDIWLNEAHHTAMCLGDGRLGQFSKSETGGISGARGDQTGYEAYVGSYYSYPWDGVLEYVGGDTEPHETVQPPMQDAGGKLKVDGYWGAKTSFVLQQVVGAPYKDGIISRQNPEHKGRLAACTSGWEWALGDGSGSPAIKRLQTEIGVKADGIFGPETANALIRRFQAETGAKETGRLEEQDESVKAFQRRLNQGLI